MSEAKTLFTRLLKNNNIVVAANRQHLLEKFMQHAENVTALGVIIENQNQLMAKWKLQDRVADIIQQPVRVLNGTVGKPYETRFDVEKLTWNDIRHFKFEGLDKVGLRYDDKSKQLTGIPTESGDLQFVFKFKMSGEPEEDSFHEKVITIIVNPDPKSLWKNVNSNRDDPYWKEDDVTVFAPLNDRHILASSKRGRSHANVGSFREDDFAFAALENRWGIVVVADGAGSARISRKGSALACNGVVDYFKEPASQQSMLEFDELLQQHNNSTGHDTQQKLNRFVYNNLGKAAFQVHKKLEAFAKQENVALKDLNSTLIFTLFKKYEIGYALLSFGVGDCPIALLNKDITEVHLMNWLDVGEFGGGTRFITMPEIFQSDKFATRFGFKLVKDFSYLMLMSDGIYDPKFVVEANLPNIKKWQEFLADLNGKNDDGTSVELRADNNNIADEFSQWMDFWSSGNHDDRTLAIVF